MFQQVFEKPLSKIFILLLVLLLLLTACSGSGISTKGAVTRHFTPAEQRSISQENNGYSADFTIETWIGQQGNNKLWYHPADKDFCIPAYDTSTCVIPFIITIETTTPDKKFTTDVGILIETELSSYNYPDIKYGFFNPAALDEAAKEYNQNSYWQETYDMWEYIWQSPNTGGMGGHKEIALPATKRGDKYVFPGFMVIPNYYSPAHPEGNNSILPEDGITLYMVTGVALEKREGMRYGTPEGDLQMAINNKKSLIQQARNVRQQAAKNTNLTVDEYIQNYASSFSNMTAEECATLDYDLSVQLLAK